MTGTQPAVMIVLLRVLLKTRILVMRLHLEQPEVLHAQVEYVIPLAVRQEFVRRRILVGTQFSKPGKVAMTATLLVAMIVLQLV
jgi:hypothetical protein